MAGATATISCSACGKSYSWKPQYAGKTLHCSCGAKFKAPKDDPAAEVARQAPPPIPTAPPDSAADNFDEILDFADYDVSGHHASQPEVPKAASGKVSVFVPGKKAGLGTAEDYKPVEPKKKTPVTLPVWQEFYIPIALIAVGFLGACWFGAVADFSHVIYRIIFVIVECIINLLVGFLGMLTASKLLDLGLGDVRSAVLKVAAIALISGTATDVLMTQALWMAVTASVMINIMAMGYFFEMEVQEITTVSGILWIYKMISILIVIGVSVSGGGTLFKSN